MTSHLLLRPRGTRGLVHEVTPESAGWGYVGFALWRLAPGDRAEGLTGAREAILVLVEGKAEVTGAGSDWGEMGDRMAVWDRSPPHALYLPPGQPWSAQATTPCALAVCTAPSPGGREAQALGPEGIELSPRGRGTNARFVNNVAMEGRDVADSLLVTEVFTPAGHWSSYPSHRHDEDDPPRITYLEETYYMRLNPAAGWGVQRVYTEDGSLDETMAVRAADPSARPRQPREDGGLRRWLLHVRGVRSAAPVGRGSPCHGPPKLAR